MTTFFFTFFLMAMVALLLMIAPSLMSKKSNFSREKTSAFECGFNPHSKARVSFSMRFFLATIIFLIFDVELVLLMPVAVSINNLMLLPATMTTFFVLLVLLLGLLYEWMQGALNWF